MFSLTLRFPFGHRFRTTVRTTGFLCSLPPEVVSSNDLLKYDEVIRKDGDFFVYIVDRRVFDNLINLQI